MKSKLMVLLSVVLAVLLSSCAPEGESYSNTVYQGRLENGTWESAPISFSQDGKIYDNEVVQISVDSGNVTFKLKNADIVSRSTTYGEGNDLLDPYNPDKTLVVRASYVNDELSSIEIDGGFFLRGIGSSFVITKVSSTPEKWEENYNPVADLNDFEFIDNETGVTLVKYNGDDPYLIIPSTIEGKAVTKIANGAFSGLSYTSSSVSAPYDIVLPDTLTTIEDNAFSSIGIRKMTIPDSVTTFGNAFTDCLNLEELVIGSGVNAWPERFNTNLKSLVISDKNEHLKVKDGLIMSKDGKTLFAYIPECTSKDLVIPQSVENVGETFFSVWSPDYKFDSITIENNDNITVPGNSTITMSEATLTINGSNVTFDVPIYVNRIDIEESTVNASTLDSTSISIVSSTIAPSGTWAEVMVKAYEEVYIDESEIKGTLSVSDKYLSTANSYTIKVLGSTLAYFNLNGKTKLTSMDLTGSKVENIYWTFSSPVDITEIKMPQSVTGYLRINIENADAVIGNIDLPYYEIYSDTDEDTWIFRINSDAEVNVDYAEEYGEQPFSRI